ncbi:high affinity copper transporter [Tricharina praecox]|uniref:high affinity copper transporter n=1 Tax=Tricharina praecox TaxID=43433 RepID=UPI00221F9BD5|nr:high affinity copper transporter [Tricharina praecox]KAI5844259.1 high affinity copper transporter [Tricharina praecox]
MDHSMHMGSATTTTSAAAAASSSAFSAEAAAACQMQMLWNWSTLNSCFLSSSWHIRSHSQFAGSCVGVFLLVVLIEGLRRGGREWDRWIVRRHVRQRGNEEGIEGKKGTETGTGMGTGMGMGTMVGMAKGTKVTPTLLQQAGRTAIYTALFGAGYFIMLLAMYYNGYIIFSILLGAFVGNAVFGWDTVG